MRSLVWIASGVLVLCVVLLVAFRWRQREATTAPNVSAIEMDVRDNLPIGSSRTMVEAYLAGRGIDHFSEEGGTEVGVIHGAPETIHRLFYTAVVRTDVQILFQFDEHNRLSHYAVEEINKGP